MLEEEEGHFVLPREMGRWREEEDAVLRDAINQMGMNWNNVAEFFFGSRNKKQCRDRYTVLITQPPEKPRHPSQIRLEKLDQIYKNNIYQRLLIRSEPGMIEAGSTLETAVTNSLENVVRSIISDIAPNNQESIIKLLARSLDPISNSSMVTAAKVSLISKDRTVIRTADSILFNCGSSGTVAKAIEIAKVGLRPDQIQNNKFGKYVRARAKQDYEDIIDGVGMKPKQYSCRIPLEDVQAGIQDGLNMCGDIVPSKLRNPRVSPEIKLNRVSFVERATTLKGAWNKYKNGGNVRIGRKTFSTCLKLISKDTVAQHSVDYFICLISSHLDKLKLVLGNLPLTNPDKNLLVPFVTSVKQFFLLDYSSHLHTSCSENKFKGHCCLNGAGGDCVCKGKCCRDCFVAFCFAFIVQDKLKEYTDPKIIELSSALGFTHQVLFLHGAHIMRRRIQDSKICNVKLKLAFDHLFLTWDFAHKFNPTQYLEGQKDYFGKGGLSYFGCSLQLGSDGELQFFDYLLARSSSQDVEIVLSLLFLICKQISQQFPHVRVLFIQSDNAPNFQNCTLHFFIAALNLYLVDHGIDIHIQAIIYSEAQCGKTATDCHFSHCKSVVQEAVNHHERATTPKEIYDILNKNQLVGMMLTLVDLPELITFFGDKLRNIYKELKIPSRTITETRYHDDVLEILQSSNISGTSIEIDYELLSACFSNLETFEQSIRIISQFSNLESFISRRKPRQAKYQDHFEPKPSLNAIIATCVTNALNTTTGIITTLPLLGERFLDIFSRWTPEAIFATIQNITVDLPYFPRGSKVVDHEIFVLPLNFREIHSSGWALGGKSKKNLALPPGTRAQLQQMWNIGATTGNKNSAESAVEQLSSHAEFSGPYAQLAISIEPIRNIFSGMTANAAKEKKIVADSTTPVQKRKRIFQHSQPDNNFKKKVKKQ
jgi:hypothetical protein